MSTRQFCSILIGTTAVLCSALSCCAKKPAAPRLSVRQLTIGESVIHVEQAVTPDERARGLMWRESLPRDNGMLFVYEQPEMPAFWMKNTPIPLSVAFIDRLGVIVGVLDMEPGSLDRHSPRVPILYALEMNQGWFADNSVRVGHKVKGLPDTGDQDD